MKHLGGQEQWEMKHFSGNRPVMSFSEGTTINRAGTVQPLPYVEEGLKRLAADIVSTWRSHPRWNLAVIRWSVSQPSRLRQCSCFGAPLYLLHAGRFMFSLLSSCSTTHVGLAVSGGAETCSDFSSVASCLNGEVGRRVATQILLDLRTNFLRLRSKPVSRPKDYGVSARWKLGTITNW